MERRRPDATEVLARVALVLLAHFHFPKATERKGDRRTLTTQVMQAFSAG